MKSWQALHNSLRVFKLIWSVHPWRTTLWLLLPLGIGGLTYPLYGARKDMIDVIAAHVQGDFFQSAMRELALPMILLFLATFGQFLLTTISRVLTLRLQDRGTILIREAVWHKAFRLEFATIEQSHTQDALRRANEFAGTQLLQLASSQTEMLRILLTMVSTLLVILAINPWIASVVTAAAAPALLIKIRTEIAIKSLNREATHDGRRAEYINRILTDKTYAKELRVFGFAEELLRRFQDLLKPVLQKRGDLRRREIKAGGWIGLCNIVVFGFSLYTLASGIHDGVSAGEAIVVIWAVLSVQQAVLQLVFPVQAFVASALGARDLLELLQLPETASTSTTADGRAIPNEENFQIDTLEFKNVSFRYPNTDRYVLRNLNLLIHRGEKIAIVGENGSGKSTLIKLLTGLYEPTSGTLLLNGRRLREYSPELLYRKISVVMQNFTRFPLTFEENLQLGNVQNLQDDPQDCTRSRLQSDHSESVRLESFLGRLKFRDVINAAPQGWQTRLGGFGDSAYELSGGQWSLLAMARSTLKSSDLVILDELSSALDPLAEVQVFRHYQELFRDETVVLISHRLGWARYSDRILVLKRGVLVESGTHDDLMSDEGEYSRLYNLQAQWYATN
ncbi:ABC transporter ATP-binding protein [Tumebacillus flagellatus]|uniref:ABC transporter ATP-binding protein n=1 Tax=Tumebacillus flagellatus TaxID=1157490 RepID=A0A074LT35_9BACL|nr:ABC transporter ATP-binding protein [Tumebacillus flagellatus]KEO84159.1 hypothetical protein EL26_06750 [Tumebacillus flagellatus]